MPESAKADSTKRAGGERSFREYAEHVSNVAWIGETPWAIYGRALMPLCMPHVPVEVNRTELREAIKRHKALLAVWTTEWDAFDASEWWWTVCDQRDYDVATVSSSNGRASIRQGLRQCSVSRVQAVDFSHLAYPVYRAAVERYGDHAPTEPEYAESIARTAAYPGTEFWGAFRDGSIAAFAVCQILDGAVQLISAKSDPRFHKYEPNSALFYTMSKHYLSADLFYVSNGSRTLWHPTNINTFLEKLGFRRVFCRVNVELLTTARLVDQSRIGDWGSFLLLDRLFGTRWEQLEGLSKLVRIADTFR